MELLSFERLEETQQIDEFLKANGHAKSAYWTSGNQLGSAMWIWMSTGQPFNSTFNFWAAGGPPLVKSQQSCMSTEGSIWSAENCMDNKHFICEQTRCFYYNYVTTNRATTQGNTTILPGVTQVSNRAVLHLVKKITPHPSSGSTIQEQQQDEQIQKEKESQPNPTAPSPSASIQSLITKSRASIPSVTAFTTPSSLKIMTSPQPDINETITTTTEQLIKIMPPTTELQQIKVMPAAELKPENPANATYTNEIIPNHQISPLQLLQPPTKEFTPSEPEREKHTNKTLAGILSRKETFSWALKDDTSH
ncbi:uncharacterized protein [Cherax quadricarinatus]|nr:uncharacterized protein LOC128686624 isoform X2 [Cherax quadricarinatus]